MHSCHKCNARTPWNRGLIGREELVTNHSGLRQTLLTESNTVVFVQLESMFPSGLEQDLSPVNLQGFLKEEPPFLQLGW